MIGSDPLFGVWSFGGSTTRPSSALLRAARRLGKFDLDYVTLRNYAWLRDVTLRYGPGGEITRNATTLTPEWRSWAEREFHAALFFRAALSFRANPNHDHVCY